MELGQLAPFAGQADPSSLDWQRTSRSLMARFSGQAPSNRRALDPLNPLNP